MKEVHFNLTAGSVAAFADMFGLQLDEEVLGKMQTQVPGVLAGIEALWGVDVTDAEMSVIFPVDR